MTMRLRTLLGDHPGTSALKDGSLRSDLGNLKPRDLEGRRVGIRSFTTTTGAWLRGILANEHGVDLDAVHWVTFEDAHVAEYIDTTERAPAGRPIIQMLLDGELDA